MSHNLNYVAQIKRNQKTLFNDISDLINHEKPLDSFYEIEKDHGRHSKWYIYVYDAFKGNKTKEWKSLKKYIEVRKFSRNVKTNEVSESIRYYMTNMDSNNAEFYHRGIRNHWKIENSLHWVKDVFHNEEKIELKIGMVPLILLLLAPLL